MTNQTIIQELKARVENNLRSGLGLSDSELKTVLKT